MTVAHVILEMDVKISSNWTLTTMFQYFHMTTYSVKVTDLGVFYWQQ